MALSAQGGAVSEPCAQRSGGRWAAVDPRRAAGGGGVWHSGSSLRARRSSRSSRSSLVQDLRASKHSVARKTPVEGG